MATAVVAGSVMLFVEPGHKDPGSNRTGKPAPAPATASTNSKIPAARSALPLPPKTIDSRTLPDTSGGAANLALRVTGMVTASGGQPLGGHLVVLLSSQINERHSTRTRVDGSFAMERVSPASDYRITVSPLGQLKRKTESPLDIGSRTPPIHIALETPELGTLSAMIVNEEGAPLPGFRLRLRSDEKLRWRQDVQADDSGWLEVSDVPLGHLTFTSLRDRVMSVTGFELTANPAEPLMLIVDGGTRQLAGYVLDQFNEPVPGATVMLNWKRESAATRSISYFRTYSGPDGRFTLNDIGPGEHELIVASSQTAIRRRVDTTGSFTELTIVLEQEALH